MGPVGRFFSFWFGVFFLCLCPLIPMCCDVVVKEGPVWIRPNSPNEPSGVIAGFALLLILSVVFSIMCFVASDG